MLKVGIPRALLFYDYYMFWKTFFEELDAEVIISDKTTKAILDKGVGVCVDEACMPVKIFHGHVINLRDKVDYLFIPRLTSIAEGEYVCPKFGGLPDMIKNSIPNLPRIINIEINMKKSSAEGLKSIKEIGSYFSCNKRKIMRAYNKAKESYLNHKKQFKKGIPNWIGNASSTVGVENIEYNFKVALLGHPYNIYDPYVNMNLLKKLETNFVEIITPEMIDENMINERASRLRKKMFWTFGRRIIGAAMYLIERNNLHGIIYIMSFGCGLDSFICDMVERRARAAGIPFSVFVIDEHTGEAGVNTRIEAFVDMIMWRRNNENYISTYG